VFVSDVQEKGNEMKRNGREDEGEDEDQED